MFYIKSTDWKVERRKTGWGPWDPMNGIELSGFSFCFIYVKLGAGEADQQTNQKTQVRARKGIT